MRAAKKPVKATAKAAAKVTPAAKAAATTPAPAPVPAPEPAPIGLPVWINTNCQMSRPQPVANTIGNRGLTTAGFIESLGQPVVLKMPVDGALTTALFDETEKMPDVIRKNYYVPRVDRVAAKPDPYEAEPVRRGRAARQARANDQRRQQDEDEQRAAARRARDRAEESDDDEDDDNARDDLLPQAAPARVAAPAAVPVRAAPVRAHAVPAHAVPAHAAPAHAPAADEQEGPPHANDNDRWFWNIIRQFGGADGVTRESLERIVNKGVSDAERERFRDRYVYWFEHLRVRIEADGFLQGTPTRKLVRPHEIISHCIFQGWAIYSNLRVDMAMLANIVDLKMYFDVHRSVNEDLRRGCTDA